MSCAQPTHLYSSTTVLKCQKGNCFDFSTLLCSMLIGSGYDAYCVNGYGSLDLCLMDLTREVCPLTVKAKEVCLIPLLICKLSRLPIRLRGSGSALTILGEARTGWVSDLATLRGVRIVSLPWPTLREAGPHPGCPYTHGFLSHHYASSVAPGPLFQSLGDFSVLSITQSSVLPAAVPPALS